MSVEFISQDDLAFTIVEGANGVKLGVKLLSIRERFKTFKIIDAEDQSNPLRMAWIFTALTVREIDGVPVPMPKNMNEVERLIEKLDDEGINVVQKFIVDTKSKMGEEAKN